MARKNLDAILPAASAARQAPQSKQDQVTAPAARRKKSELFPAAVFLTVITLAMVGLVAWSMRHAPADTFWAAVGFVAALFGGSSLVGLWSLSGSGETVVEPIKNEHLIDTFSLSLGNLFPTFDDYRFGP